MAKKRTNPWFHFPPLLVALYFRFVFVAARMTQQLLVQQVGCIPQAIPVQLEGAPVYCSVYSLTTDAEVSEANALLAPIGLGALRLAVVAPRLHWF